MIILLVIPYCGLLKLNVTHNAYSSSIQRCGDRRIGMTKFLTASLALALMVPSATPVMARDPEQQRLRAAAEQGDIIPLNRLIADVRSRAPYRDMNYLGGPQYDARQMVYALKFMDGNKVVIVYVDARTGRIVGRR